jgi:SAM-dependent methyltransferase
VRESAMPGGVPAHEHRSIEQLREQYGVERELAARLRGAGQAERRRLYAQVYAEFARRVPHQPMLTHRNDAQARSHEVELQTRLLERFLRPRATFLEIGAGDMALCVHLARRVRRAFAVEPCAEMWRGIELPSNVTILENDAAPLDLPAESIELAFSCHFIEHLHPDDAREHVLEMHRLLTPRGHYVCVTPNRLWGPHDVSRYFDDVALGLHLKEYDHAEIAALLRAAGFRRVAVLRGIGRPPTRWPTAPYRLAAALLGRLAPARRRRLLSLLSRANEPFRALEQVVLVGAR